MDLAVREGRGFLHEETLNQCQFCTELMLRLNEEFIEAKLNFDGVEGRYRMEQDIIRLRRELLRLSKMIDMTRR